METICTHETINCLVLAHIYIYVIKIEEYQLQEQFEINRSEPVGKKKADTENNNMRSQLLQLHIHIVEVEIAENYHSLNHIHFNIYSVRSPSIDLIESRHYYCGLEAE